MPAHWHGGNPESLAPCEAAPGLSFVLNGKPTITILTELWKGRARGISTRCHLGKDYMAGGLGNVFPSLSGCLFLVLLPQYHAIPIWWVGERWWVVKAGPNPYCLVTQETRWFLKWSISATGTASGSAAITGNNANEEHSIHLLCHLHTLLLHLCTVQSQWQGEKVDGNPHMSSVPRAGFECLEEKILCPILCDRADLYP